MSAHASTAFTDFWNNPGATGVSTSAIKPILMVVAVIPTSLAGAALPSGAAEVVPLADVPADADVAAAGADEELPAELHPAASRTAAASTATSPARRMRTGKRRPGRLPPGPSLFDLTAVPSTTPLPVSRDPAAFCSRVTD
jgi:hypothetical protein